MRDFCRRFPQRFLVNSKKATDVYKSLNKMFCIAILTKCLRFGKTLTDHWPVVTWWYSATNFVGNQVKVGLCEAVLSSDSSQVFRRWQLYTWVSQRAIFDLANVLLFSVCDTLMLTRYFMTYCGILGIIKIPSKLDFLMKLESIVYVVMHESQRQTTTFLTWRTITTFEILKSYPIWY